MILKNIEKLNKLIENYDKIMSLIDENNKKEDKKEDKKEEIKRYSFFNTPENQKKYIAELEKRENND